MNILPWVINPFAICVYAVVLFFIIFRYIYPFIRNKIYTFENYRDFQTLDREINCNYNPSIVSMLINNEVEVKDITADIMNLYAKKYLTVEKLNDKLEIKVNITKEEFDKLPSSDRYIIRMLIKKVGDFDFRNWRNLVIKKYEGLNLVEKYKGNLKVFLMIIIGTCIPYNIIGKIFNFDIWGLMIGSIIVMFLATVILAAYNSVRQNENMQNISLNQEGKNELKKWLRFKKFIKEYTLIKDKNIQDVVLYEKYIPYAVAMGVNKNYKETIYSVFNEKEIKEILKDSKIDFYNEFLRKNLKLKI